MKKSFEKMLKGYQQFRALHAQGKESLMQTLSHQGQKPEVMIVACCDSRVDPALILQCNPGELFVVRNVANIVPPYEKDSLHHGTSAALEFGVCFLKVKHLILLGHSQCGGIQALINAHNFPENDFISNWVSILKVDDFCLKDADVYAQQALEQSYKNCLAFPWIHQKVTAGELVVHAWFFDIKSGQIFVYLPSNSSYRPLE